MTLKNIYELQSPFLNCRLIMEEGWPNKPGSGVVWGNLQIFPVKVPHGKEVLGEVTIKGTQNKIPVYWSTAGGLWKGLTSKLLVVKLLPWAQTETGAWVCSGYASGQRNGFWLLSAHRHQTAVQSTHRLWSPGGTGDVKHSSWWWVGSCGENARQTGRPKGIVRVCWECQAEDVVRLE